MITPDQFIEKWKYNRDSERAAAHSYFQDLCELLDIARPYEVPELDGKYGFEVALRQDDNRGGFADVYKQGCFVGEFKRPGADLKEALWQVMKYAPPLGNPPILLVSDRRTIYIHTRINGQPSQIIFIPIDEIAKPSVLTLLRWALTEPYRFADYGNQNQLMKAAAEAYLPRRPVPVVDVRHERDLVKGFAEQAQQSLNKLQIGDRKVFIDDPGYHAWFKYASADFRYRWKSEYNDQRTLHRDLQPLQDNLASMLTDMAVLLQLHLIPGDSGDGKTWYGLDESQYNVSTAKVDAILEQRSRIWTAIEQLQDMSARVTRVV